MAVGAALADAEWGECVVAPVPVPPALAAEVRRAIGVVPDWLPRLAPLPWLVRADCEIIRSRLAYAPPKLSELIGLVVSQENSCRYCYGVQRAILKIQGYRDDTIDRMLRDFHVAELSRAESAALDFARRVARASPLPDRAEFDGVVRAGLAPMAVVEVAAVAALAGFANRVSTLLALPPEALESTVRHPLFRLVRPFLAWRMRPRPASPAAAPPANDGPCGRVVAALGRSPLAHSVRRIIDEAWASAVLPRRTKTLMLAVIGRAVGCAYAEEEARALLPTEGIGPADLDEILATLGSGRLDARERRLVPFARETVRYQPAAIQARLREACEGFRPEELLETVGVVALANAVCRLSVVLDTC